PLAASRARQSGSNPYRSRRQLACAAVALDRAAASDSAAAVMSERSEGRGRARGTASNHPNSWLDQASMGAVTVRASSRARPKALTGRGGSLSARQQSDRMSYPHLRIFTRCGTSSTLVRIVLFHTVYEPRKCGAEPRSSSIPSPGQGNNHHSDGDENRADSVSPDVVAPAHRDETARPPGQRR